MTDTPTIALYYKEHDPMKRKMFLDQSIAAGKMKRQMLFEKKSGRFAMAVLQNWDRYTRRWIPGIVDGHGIQ